MSDGGHEKWPAFPLWNIDFAQRVSGDISTCIERKHHSVKAKRNCIINTQSIAMF